MPWSEPSAQSNDGSRTKEGDGAAARGFQVWDVEKSQVLEEPHTVIRGLHNGAVTEETLPGYGTSHPTRIGLWLDRYDVSGITASTFNATALYSNDGRFGSLEKPNRQVLKDIKIRTSGEIREDVIPDATLVERTIGKDGKVERRGIWVHGDFTARVRVHKILLSILLPKKDVTGAQRAYVRDQTDNLHFFTDTTNPPAWHLFTGGVFSEQDKTWRITYEWISDPGILAIDNGQIFFPFQLQSRYTYPFFGVNKLPNAPGKTFWTRAPFHIIRVVSRNHLPKLPNGNSEQPGFIQIQRHSTDKDAWRQFPGIIT